MNRLDPDRVMDILAEAMELPAPRRNAFLDSTCVGEPELRRELEDLLACADPASAVFDAALQQVVQPDPEQIGQYQIIEPIGEGGMAIVYKAQQRRPVDRIVAIKLIKLGMDTRQFVARFESERQALAVMNHPSIARVHDAGSTDTGRPYFVMEYVPGESILRWCDSRRLPLEDRLELFIAVCEAVEHAHRKGIIHRDLKDSNVLITDVDGHALPKVIDFGVAKVVSHRLSDRTMFTEQGQLIGTPEYMSPEQADRGTLDVDTRSDIYSLGVLLYELIAGVQPIPADVWRKGSFEQVQRIICDTEPPRPSTRLSAVGGPDATRIAERRRSALPTLIRDLRSELEWIPLKAMRKDREQRYGTASELADDIRNYLEGRPLIAGPESRWYRARKLVRRHKTGVAASAAMLMLLLAGIVATTWQAYRATRAERHALAEKTEADRRRAEAEDAKAATAQVNSFLVEMFESVDPQFARGKPVLVSDMLDKATQQLGTKLAGQPRVESSVRTALGRTYVALGHYDAADEHFTRALEIDRQVLGQDDPQTLASLQQLGRLRRMQGRLDEAKELYEQTLSRRRRVLGEEHRDTIGSINDMAVLLDRLGSPQAEAMYRQALERTRAVAGPDDPETLRVTGNLGQYLTRVGKYEEAERLLRESYTGRRRTLGDDHPDTINISTRLAFVMKYRDAWNEAESLMRDALQRSVRVFGEDHPNTIWAENGLAQLLVDQGKYEEGVSRYLHALEQARKVLGSEYDGTLGLMQAAASALSKASRGAEAQSLMREAIAGLVKVRGPDHPTTILATQNLVIMLRYEKRWSDALPLAKDGYDRLREPGRVAFDPTVRAAFLCSYGTCLSQLGRHEEAIEPLTIAREALRQTGDKEHGTLLTVLQCLVSSSRALNRPDDVARWTAELDAAIPATAPR